MPRKNPEAQATWQQNSQQQFKCHHTNCCPLNAQQRPWPKMRFALQLPSPGVQKSPWKLITGCAFARIVQVEMLPRNQKDIHSCRPNSPHTTSLGSYGLADGTVGPACMVPPSLIPRGFNQWWINICLSLHRCLYPQASRNSHRGENTVFLAERFPAIQHGRGV